MSLLINFKETRLFLLSLFSKYGVELIAWSFSLGFLNNGETLDLTWFRDVSEEEVLLYDHTPFELESLLKEIVDYLQKQECAAEEFSLNIYINQKSFDLLIKEHSSDFNDMILYNNSNKGIKGDLKIIKKL